MRFVPKRRPSPPTTPFGAWLEQWLNEHDDVTHQAFANDVGVSKGLISQWVSGSVRRISPVNLANVASVTGEPLENLERMVYGRDLGRAGEPAHRVAEEPGRYVTDRELDDLVQRAADLAVQKVLAELADPTALITRLVVALEPALGRPIDAAGSEHEGDLAVAAAAAGDAQAKRTVEAVEALPVASGESEPPGTPGTRTRRQSVPEPAGR